MLSQKKKAEINAALNNLHSILEGCKLELPPGYMALLRFNVHVARALMSGVPLPANTADAFDEACAILSTFMNALHGRNPDTCENRIIGPQRAGLPMSATVNEQLTWLEQKLDELPEAVAYQHFTAIVIASNSKDSAVLERLEDIAQVMGWSIEHD